MLPGERPQFAVAARPRKAQITKYVEREILNQLRLRHPHIIALKEVSSDEGWPAGWGLWQAGNVQRSRSSSPGA